jgi:hypothetical protein
MVLRGLQSVELLLPPFRGELAVSRSLPRRIA